MGLFSNNKKLCPICGQPTPRLLPTKVEDMPICKECDGKVDLPAGKLNEMSLDSFQEYINFYDENKALRDAFTESYRFTFGFLNGSLQIDAGNGLFRLKDYDQKLVMTAANLKNFRILEDNKPLYESGGNVLKCYQSNVPEKVNAMGPQIAQFELRMREYEMMERMQERWENANDNNNSNNNNRPSMSRPRPCFELTGPIRKFHIQLNLEHPYWNDQQWEIDAPTFDNYNPNIDDYLQKYEDKAEDLHMLAINLMELICPGAQEVYVNAGMATVVQNTVQQSATAQEAPAMDAVEEIKKYKGLLDAGIITEDEFAAKKRQLLGI